MLSQLGLRGPQLGDHAALLFRALPSKVLGAEPVAPDHPAIQGGVAKAVVEVEVTIHRPEGKVSDRPGLLHDLAPHLGGGAGIDQERQLVTQHQPDVEPEGFPALHQDPGSQLLP